MMLVAFAWYSRDASFQVLRANRWFVLVMASGSIAGALLGRLLLGVAPSAVSSPTGDPAAGLRCEGAR